MATEQSVHSIQWLALDLIHHNTMRADGEADRSFTFVKPSSPTKITLCGPRLGWRCFESFSHLVTWHSPR